MPSSLPPGVADNRIVVSSPNEKIRSDLARRIFSRCPKMPDTKDDPTSSEWRPYTFARDQWHCRICGESFLYSETVRKHIANEHNETMPPSMYEYFLGAVWQRKKLR
jgi:hypothetical protein